MWYCRTSQQFFTTRDFSLHFLKSLMRGKSIFGIHIIKSPFAKLIGRSDNVDCSDSSDYRNIDSEQRGQDIRARRHLFLNEGYHHAICSPKDSREEIIF